MDEFSLIERIRARTRARADVALGIGDDAAVLIPPPDHELVVTTDTLNVDVHFPARSRPADVGWKALASNLSDLAAMGAQPAWCTLSLAMPRADAAWLEGFADGFFALADAHHIALVGGDTTCGPLSIAITAMGWVPRGTALRRDGAQIGDEIWVTGVPGDAAAGYGRWQAGELVVEAADALERFGSASRRWLRPEPRVAAGMALRGVASACADISDGLLADLGNICRRSGVGAQLQLSAMPVSDDLLAFAGGQALAGLQLSGGEAYELCFTAAPSQHEAVKAALRHSGVAGSCVGEVVDGHEVTVVAPDGAPCTFTRVGYNHFPA